MGRKHFQEKKIECSLCGGLIDAYQSDDDSSGHRRDCPQVLSFKDSSRDFYRPKKKMSQRIRLEEDFE